ncbi:high mobility group B protein [Trifolium repens]|nr:high mobility group B protein [Trifolium repens]
MKLLIAVEFITAIAFPHRPVASSHLSISLTLSLPLWVFEFSDARVVCEETWRKKPKSKEPIAKRAEVGKGKKVKDPNVLKRPPTVFVVFIRLDCWLLSHSVVYSTFTLEPSKLANGRPNVKNVTLLQKDWWGSGIVRNKVWISNYRDVYIGSANNDWKLLTHCKKEEF